MLRGITDEQTEAAQRKYGHLINDICTVKGEGFRNGLLRACVVADALSDGVNELSFESEMCGRAMAMDHRTLIQDKMRVFIAFAKELAKDYDAGNYDLRNEDACRAAKAMVESLEPAGVHGLRRV